MAEAPKIVDAQYWTDWLADYIRGAIDRREAAANRLITGISWFWGVYTATAVLGVTLAKLTTPAWKTFLVLAPIASLSLSYMTALWSLNPIVGNARQTDRDAQELWRIILTRKLFRLRVSTALLLISVALIIMAAFLVSTTRTRTSS